ncbi:glycosyltransferase family 4 protein [Rhodopila sp.]|uniref:glycosyltransferase family 4 protein n=1 Tax=Rhodopila sp. TaxID=2480087 RepID=UPI003D0B1BDB
MKVLVIAGSLPPQVCGVGDFTGALIDALKDRDVAVAVLHRHPWRLRDVPALLWELRASDADVIHLQYPTHGFRRSLVPHLLHLGLLGRSRLTTLHDYSGQRWPIRLGMSVFTIGGRLVVTGRLDREALVKRHPWTERRLSTIPIGSNIPVGAWEPSDRFTIVHFGMLRPEKGIEEMIELARLCKQQGRPYRAVIMGAIVPHARDYAESLFKLAEDTGIEWQLNVSAQHAADVLRHAHVAYLSPPCGVHERRGTLLAAASNGVPIVARVDWETPDFLRDHVVAAAGPKQALAAIDQLADPVRLKQQSERSLALAEMFSWPTIAERYIQALQAASRKRPDRRPVNSGSETKPVAEMRVRRDPELGL